jgi:O-antigen ligase
MFLFILLALVVTLPIPTLMKMFNFGFAVNVYNILLLLILLGWFLRTNVKSKKLFLSSPLNKPIAIFIIVCIYSLVVSYFVGDYSFGSNFVYLYRFIFVIFLYFVFLNNARRIRDIKAIAYLIVVMCVYVAFVSYKQRSNIDVQSFSWGLKTLLGTFEDGSTNELGAFFAQYVPFMLALMLFSKSIVKKIVLILASLYCSIILMWSYSRGAWLAFLGSLLFLGIVKDKRILILVFVFFIFKSIILPASVTDRMSIYNEEGDLERSVEIRENVWREAIHAIKMPKYAIFGMGLNQSAAYLSRDAHNIYLRFALEFGLLGLAVFLWILFLAFRMGWKLYRSTNDPFIKGLALGFLSCLVSVSIVNFTGTRLMYGPISAYFWILMGLTARIKIMVEQEELKI